MLVVAGGGTPSSHGGGVPPPSRPGQGGYPVTPHHPDLGWGNPPPSRPGMGYPHPTIQTWDGYPLPSRPGMGYSPTIQTWDGVPPPTIQTWDGVPPPPPMVNRQTFPRINITFLRTTYAGGKNRPDILFKAKNINHFQYHFESGSLKYHADGLSCLDGPLIFKI